MQSIIIKILRLYLAHGNHLSLLSDTPIFLCNSILGDTFGVCYAILSFFLSSSEKSFLASPLLVWGAMVRFAIRREFSITSLKSHANISSILCHQYHLKWSSSFVERLIQKAQTLSVDMPRYVPS